MLENYRKWMKKKSSRAGDLRFGKKKYIEE
jgi:hypothetical protein